MAINTLYLDNGGLKRVRSTYSAQYPKNIRLEKLFQPAVLSLLQNKLNHSKFKLKFNPYKYK